MLVANEFLHDSDLLTRKTFTKSRTGSAEVQDLDSDFTTRIRSVMHLMDLPIRAGAEHDLVRMILVKRAAHDQIVKYKS